jgi:peptide/nickel transport system substrate-binding protein
MGDKKRDLWAKIPKPIFNSKILKRRMRKAEGATVRHAHKFILKRLDNVREVQRNVVIWVLVMGILIAATGLQLMWNQQSYMTEGPGKNGAYAEAVLGPINTLNPLFAETSAEQSASYLIFSRLLSYDTTGHLNYDLARNITINDAKTVYTVTIRPNVKWHDGNKLTTKDIAYTVDLMKNPNARVTDTGWNDVTTKIINNNTIEFNLKSTYSAFENALTFPILPEHILGKIAPINIRENDFSQNPIGSGPFKLNLVQNVDTKSGRKIVYMARNDKYYGGMAKLERFQLHVYDTNDSILKALSLNEVSAAAGLSPVDIQNVNTKRYNITVKPIQSGVYAVINTKSEILKDVSMRKALQSATNTPAIINKLPKGTLPLWLPITTDQLTGDLPVALKFDKSGAEKILDDNGWKLNSQKVREKDGKALKLSVVALKNSELEYVLGILTDQWRDLGITIDVKIIDPKDETQNVVQSILQPRNYDVLVYQYNIGADPDVYAYWHSSQASLNGLNYSNYSNAISDDALISARARVEPVLRNAKYLTFSRQWLADVPAIGLYQSTIQYVTSNNAMSFDKSDVLISPIDRYSDVLNWSVGSRNVYKTP